MKTFIWIIQPIGEITMVAVNANSEDQARQIAKNQVDKDWEFIDASWAASFHQEIKKPPHKTIGTFECITFGNWNI